MSSPSPPAPAHARLVERPQVLKIAPVETFTYGYGAASNSTAAAAPAVAPTRSFSFSQGGRCHCCGGIFVINNKCSNRECDHVQCAQCY